MSQGNPLAAALRPALRTIDRAFDSMLTLVWSRYRFPLHLLHDLLDLRAVGGVKVTPHAAQIRSAIVLNDKPRGSLCKNHGADGTAIPLANA